MLMRRMEVMLTVIMILLMVVRGVVMSMA